MKPRTEDQLALWLGFFIVSLGLTGLLNLDLLGWAAKVNVWLDPGLSLTPASKAYGALGGVGSVMVTLGFLAVALTIGIKLIGGRAKVYVSRFVVLFLIAFTCWWAGHFAYIAATPDKLEAFGIDFSLGLTGEAGYLLALAAGLLIANTSTRLAEWFREAARSELYIKTAIIILGCGIGLKAASAADLAQSIMLRGLAAIVEAYLIYWALVYFIARKFFGFSREWAAPLASGISICGVSAAITTGAAIRARPVVPIMVSSLVVVFSVMEMAVLPFIAKNFLADEPMVAAAWMGLAVKTDGAAVASGAVAESLVYAEASKAGIHYEPGWMVTTTTNVKVFIDLFIGVWAVLLSIIWSWKIEPRPEGQARGLPLKEIWSRFPKFVFGYLITFALFFVLGTYLPGSVDQLKTVTSETDVFRRIFFVLTFFSIGLSANFRRLWAEGLGKLALVYVVSLFGFIIWIGLAISWLFFAGVKPPLQG